MLKRILVTLPILALLILAGCSKAPVAEIQTADAAIQKAATAEAETYAPEAYRIASDTLNAAKAAKAEQDGKFALFRSYGKSKALFVSAAALADKAAQAAEAEKERMRQELMGKMTQAEELMAAAATALETAPKGKGTKADIELIKSDLASVKNAYTQVKADIDAGRYMVVKSKLETLMAQTNNIIAEIEAAKAKVGKK